MKKMSGRFHRNIICCMLLFYGASVTPTRAELKDFDYYLIGGTTVISLVPKYSLSIRPDGTFSGLSWGLPISVDWGVTHILRPSFAWYPGDHSLLVRTTYGIPMGLFEQSHFIGFLSPGLGMFGSKHASGPRAELQFWVGVGAGDNFLAKPLLGIFAEGAWERDLSHNRTFWEISAGLEVVVPLEYFFDHH
jgi:hypothetical protein